MSVVIRVTAASMILLLLVVACDSSSSVQQDVDDVTVQLNWLHYGVFGPLYAADQMGYYADEGLSVELVPGGPQVETVDRVANGEAQFGVAGADAIILARVEEKPVRAIGTILQISPVVFVARSETGITRPQDFVGKTVRLTPQLAPTFHALMARLNITPEQYSEVTLPSDLDVFEEVPVWGVYFNSFAVTLQDAGYDLNIIFPSDYGVHFYADSLFTTEEIIRENPELVRRFLAATLKGMRYAIEHPQDAGAMARQYDPTAEADLEAAKMEASVPLIYTGQQPLGWMESEVWEDMLQTLLDQGVLEAPVDVDEVYTMQFLQAVYGEEE